MGFILGIIVAIASGILGFFIGKYYLKIWEKKENKKLVKNAFEVLEGKRKNKTEIDGKIVEVNNFIIRDEKNDEKKITLNKNLLKNE